MKLGTRHFSVKNAQSYLGQKAFPVQQGVRRAGFINGISFKKTKSLSGFRKAFFFYHFPIGHFSEANFSFAEEQPHFRHLPSGGIVGFKLVRKPNEFAVFVDASAFVFNATT